MNARMGLKEFFAMEASEYLDRLDALVSASDGPERDEFVRLARALRGSALMANEQQIGEVSAALENFARALKEGRTPWDEGTKHIAIRAVDDIRILVRKVGEWSDTEDNIASAAAEELNAAAGEVKPVKTTRPQSGSDPGTRAFVARECAVVASALNAAAQKLQQGPPQPEYFDDLLKTMQPLLGLAALPEMSPIPEVMDGIERAAGIASRGEQTDDIASLFDVAERALSNAAQEITGTGAARPDSPEAREFARRFGALLDTSGDVVPIQSLYYDDAGPHILESGTPVAAPARLAQMELVAHGEHLKQAADELERAQWDTQRELRALALTSTFRSLVSAGGGPVENAVARFAHTAQDAVSKGVPLHHTADFAGYLREVGAVLTASAEGESGGLATRLTQVTARLEALATETPQPVAETASDHPTRPRADSAPDVIQENEEPEPAVTAEPADDRFEFAPEPQVVDVTVTGLPAVEGVTTDTAVTDSWAADQAAVVADIPDVAPPAESRPEPVAPYVFDDESAGPGLVPSWARYEQLLRETGSSEPALEELLDLAPPPPATPVRAEDAAAAVAADAPTEEIAAIAPPSYDDAAEVTPEVAEPSITEVAPITQPSYDDTDAMTPEVAEPSTTEVVPITQLGYDEPVDATVAYEASDTVAEDTVGYQASEPPAADAIPITELCYSGSAALDRAYTVRDQIRAALTEPELQGPQIQDLIDELLDLVDLSIEQ